MNIDQEFEKFITTFVETKIESLREQTIYSDMKPSLYRNIESIISKEVNYHIKMNCNQLKEQCDRPWFCYIQSHLSKLEWWEKAPEYLLDKRKSF